MRQHLKALILLLLLSAAPASAQVGPQLTQSVVAGGGGVSTAGTVRLDGTVGQGSVGTSSGGTFSLEAGFPLPWTIAPRSTQSPARRAFPRTAR